MEKTVCGFWKTWKTQGISFFQDCKHPGGGVPLPTGEGSKNKLQSSQNPYDLGLGV